MPTWLTHTHPPEKSVIRTPAYFSENSHEDDSIKRKGDRTKRVKSFELTIKTWISLAHKKWYCQLSSDLVGSTPKGNRFFKESAAKESTEKYKIKQNGFQVITDV